MFTCLKCLHRAAAGAQLCSGVRHFVGCPEFEGLKNWALNELKSSCTTVPQTKIRLGSLKLVLPERILSDAGEIM